LKLEKGLPSSFFFITFQDFAGDTRGSRAPSRRGAKYAAAGVADQIDQLMRSGCEIGLHGVNAWIDSSRGRHELDEIRRITGKEEIGVRMHWLYFDQDSPAALEGAGASYDSTVGYNETVGYRAGTTQVYKPLEAARLLELPLHIMDTALLFPSYLHCSDEKASLRISRIVDNASQFGGTVTVNWHDRSLASERLWGDCYVRLLDQFREKRAWFATASDAVSWFRKRRSARFDNVTWESGVLRIEVSVEALDELPGLQLRVQHGSRSQDFFINSKLFACALDPCLAIAGTGTVTA